MKTFLLKLASLVIVTASLAIGAFGQDQSKNKKKVPPKEGSPPVVRPAKKPPVKRPRPTPGKKDPGATGSMKAPLPK